MLSGRSTLSGRELLEKALVVLQAPQTGIQHQISIEYGTTGQKLSNPWTYPLPIPAFSSLPRVTIVSVRGTGFKADNQVLFVFNAPYSSDGSPITPSSAHLPDATHNKARIFLNPNNPIAPRPTHLHCLSTNDQKRATYAHPHPSCALHLTKTGEAMLRTEIWTETNAQGAVAQQRSQTLTAKGTLYGLLVVNRTIVGAYDGPSNTYELEAACCVASSLRDPSGMNMLKKVLRAAEQAPAQSIHLLPQQDLGVAPVYAVGVVDGAVQVNNAATAKHIFYIDRRTFKMQGWDEYTVDAHGRATRVRSLRLVVNETLPPDRVSADIFTFQPPATAMQYPN